MKPLVERISGGLWVQQFTSGWGFGLGYDPDGGELKLKNIGNEVDTGSR